MASSLVCQTPSKNLAASIQLNRLRRVTLGPLRRKASEVPTSRNRACLWAREPRQGVGVSWQILLYRALQRGFSARSRLA
eukprot:4383394-Lingulodinium_polyedra.AAC.1